MVFRLRLDLKALLGLSLLLLIVIFYIKLQNVVNIFAVSFLISYILIPMVHWVERLLKVPRVIAVLLIFSLFTFVVVLVAVFFLPILYAEVISVIKGVPSYLELLLNKVQTLLSRYGYSIDFNQMTGFLFAKLKEHGTFILSSSMMILGSVFSSLSTFLGLFIIPVLVFYFLKDFEYILKKMLRLITDNTGIDFFYYNKQFNEILRKYFRGQLLVCFCLGLMYGALNFLVGINGGFAIGFISGLLSFVPYLGFIFGISISIIMAYVQFTDLLHPFMVLIGFGVVQGIESYLLTPKLVGESLGLHPIAVIFSLFVGGYLMGVGGMILSIPVAAFLKIVLGNYLEFISKNKNVDNLP
ncbi:MAG: AI-2E family transporter [Calditerrivibrio sp.]|nr:AI-2E family transporter [Calditerrivibrio sp.]